MGRLDGKVCVVTGACGGIGAAACELFAREGATVAGADIAENAPGELSMQVDVTHEGRVIEMYEHVLQTYGRIDVLFNNAGIAPPDDRSILETTLELPRIRPAELWELMWRESIQDRWAVATAPVRLGP